MEFQYLDGGNSEIQDMQAEAYLYASSGTTGIAASGVIEGLVVRQTSTASGSVLIDAGACVNQASLGQGASRLINPSQKTLDVFTANPVGGLPRNDIVVFDSVTKLIAVIVGTPNATPTDPTVPATSVALARLRHAASATTIPTAKIDNLIVSTGLRGAPRIGASVNLTDSWATQATRTHNGTWDIGENSGGFVGALTANTTPIVIPAGKGGLYAVSLGLANSATMSGNGSFVQLGLGGTLLPGSKSAYRVSVPINTSDGSIALTLPLAAGCSLMIISGLTAAAYGVDATLSCYRIGD